MRILIALDESPRALAAVRQVLRMRAAGLSTELVVAHVQRPPQLYEWTMTTDATVIDAAAQAAGAHAMAPGLSLLAEAGIPASSIECLVRQGDPATVLVDLAEALACDLICMGTHGTGWLASTRLGRVATEVTQHAHCAVLVARDADDDGDDAADAPAESP